MPKSQGRPTKSASGGRAFGRRRSGATSASRSDSLATVGGNPRWFVPVMLGLMLIGLLWIVTFYLTKQQYPVESWGRWNLAAGFGFVMAGFLMTTRWR